MLYKCLSYNNSLEHLHVLPVSFLILVDGLSITQWSNVLNFVSCPWHFLWQIASEFCILYLRIRDKRQYFECWHLLSLQLLIVQVLFVVLFFKCLLRNFPVSFAICSVYRKQFKLRVLLEGCICWNIETSCFIHSFI